MTKTILALTVGLVLAGCSMAPEYHRPDAPQGASWQATTEEAKVPGWKTQFTDPTLQRLVEVALKENRDLRISALNVQSYEAQYRIQRAAQLPSVNAAAGSSRSHSSIDLTTPGYSQYNTQYSASVGITSYELDLFGRVQSLKDKALETYLSQVEAQRSTQISLVASVASAYYTLIADNELLALTESTLKTEQESYSLVSRKHELGAASDMDLAQARSALDSAKATLAQTRRTQNTDRNALLLLLGTSLPADIKLPDSLNEVHIPAIPVGAPSSLLQQRPDILAAEHSLKAANANIGAARAAFFPTISLTATAGSASTDLSNLFAGGRNTWTFAPQLNLPIFDGGLRVADLDVANIAAKSAVASYEKSIQTAFSEVADSLDSLKNYQDQLAAQQSVVDANQTYFTLADQRYLQGVDSYLTRLDAQRSLFSARQTLVSTRLAALNNQVTLFKAIGGGWQE